MIEGLPIYVTGVFIATTLLTLFLFYRIIKKSNLGYRKTTTIAGLSGWLILQMVLSLKGFYYSDLDVMPPNFLWLFVPTIILILYLFTTQHGRIFIDSLPLLEITWLNIVRIPVEIVLYWLAIHKAIPELMTFEGRNFDILAGITAPFIAYFGLQQQKLNKNVVLAWNIVSLGLLLNIIINALLSAPLPIQQFAFDQPNIGVLYFPFSWLPGFIVPIVLFGHFVSIRRLFQGE